MCAPLPCPWIIGLPMCAYTRAVLSHLAERTLVTDTLQHYDVGDCLRLSWDIPVRPSRVVGARADVVRTTAQSACLGHPGTLSGNSGHCS